MKSRAEWREAVDAMAAVPLWYRMMGLVIVLGSFVVLGVWLFVAGWMIGHG